MQSQFLHKRFIATLCLLSVFGLADAAFAAPKLKLSPNKLPDSMRGQAYSETLSVSGGAAPYSWSLTGALPTGLTFTPMGATAVISGVPAEANTFNFRVTLTDSATPPDSVFFDYTVIIYPGCSFVGSNAGAVSFGAIDPSTAPGPILGEITQQIQIACDSGLTFTVTANPAGGWTLNSGVNTISYTLGFNASGTGLGDLPMDLLTSNSRILQTDYQNAAGGLYSNNQAIALTVAWGTGKTAGSLAATLPISSISGTILNTCVVTQPADTLVFTIDPLAALTTAVLSPSGLDLMIKCTLNAPVSISASSKCGGLAENGSASCGGFIIPYTFNYITNTSGSGFGTGFDIPVGIGGSAIQSNYLNAPSGSGYADVQTVTISY